MSDLIRARQWLSKRFACDKKIKDIIEYLIVSQIRKGRFMKSDTDVYILLINISESEQEHADIIAYNFPMIKDAYIFLEEDDNAKITAICAELKHDEKKTLPYYYSMVDRQKSIDMFFRKIFPGTKGTIESILTELVDKKVGEDKKNIVLFSTELQFREYVIALCELYCNFPGFSLKVASSFTCVELYAKIKKTYVKLPPSLSEEDNANNWLRTKCQRFKKSDIKDIFILLIKEKLSEANITKYPAYIDILSCDMTNDQIIRYMKILVRSHAKVCDAEVMIGKNGLIAYIK